MSKSDLAEKVVAICRRASEVILEVYNDPSAFEVDIKADDSPVTKADLAANAVIETMLRDLDPDIPILAEESTMVPFEQRKHWKKYWIVDPLDGTKEFIRRNNQFTVNIALVENNVPQIGVVYVPVTHVAYVGVVGEGSAYKVEHDTRREIHCRSLAPESRALSIVASAHHSNEETEKFISLMNEAFGESECQSVGSSLKFCLLAEGIADVYPRLGPTSEWDTAAAQAVLSAAGGAVYQYDLSELRYNVKDNILNPFFYAVADPSYDWQSLIKKSQDN